MKGPAFIAACLLVLTASAVGAEVRMSSGNICHDEESPNWGQMKAYTPFDSMAACEREGGRPVDPGRRDGSEASGNGGEGQRRQRIGDGAMSPELVERLAKARRANPAAFAYYDQHRGPEVKMKCPIICRWVLPD